MNRYLDIAPEVKEALDAGKPVVALESTIISHGMPYPQNVETALKVESIIREAGAVPATIAIIGGRLKAGLTREEIDYLGKTGAGIPKASRRDLPVLVAQGRDGACTVTTTMMIADMAGIRVFATGGIGGVHRGAQETFDISADLEELADTSVMVICAGAKSILDLGLTLEYLETHGVTVIGYGTDELPAFYTRKSGFGVDYELDTPAELAKAFHVKRELGLRGGLLVTNPIPEEYSMDKAVIDKAIAEAVEDAKKDGIHGKATTPYPAREDQGSDRRRQPRFQHPARVQQRPPRRCRRGGAGEARTVSGALSLGVIGGADGPTAVFVTGSPAPFVIYLLAINVLAFAVYGWDKARSKVQGARRVPEKTLFLLAILGGSVGAILGMRVWHHKTRHWYFKYGLPAILLAQLALAWYLGGLH